MKNKFMQMLFTPRDFIFKTWVIIIIINIVTR